MWAMHTIINFGTLGRRIFSGVTVGLSLLLGCISVSFGSPLSYNGVVGSKLHGNLQ